MLILGNIQLACSKAYGSRLKFVIVLAMYVGGCQSTGDYSTIPQERVERIAAGRTTIDQVRELLGPPSSRTISGSLVEFVYRYPVENPLAYQTEPVFDELVITFDQQGIVRTHRIRREDRVPDPRELTK